MMPPVERAPLPTLPTVAEAVGQPAVQPAGPPQPVRIRIDPWADLEVDGKLTGRGKREYDLMLTPGVHKLRLMHMHAQTEEREVTVPSSGPPLEVSVQVHRAKPARLVVVTGPDDPEVIVDGVHKGSAHESEASPIMIALPDRTHERRIKILLHQPGKADQMIERVMVAGERMDVPARMRDPGPEDEPRSVIEVSDDEPTPPE